MSDGTGFGGMPSFAGGGTALSPSIQEWLQMQQLAQAQAQGQAQAPGQMMAQPPQFAQDVPQAVPPGYSGFAPQTPPTGAPTDVVRPEAASLASAAMNALGPSSAQAATPQMSDREALIASAKRIGADPLDLATVMSYETGGTMSPSQYGGAGGRHVGLIQFGPREADRYGASPNQSFQEQLPAVERYLTARGFQPGMSRLDLYSTINAGSPGLYGASDAKNGGAPGSVLDKVRDQMGPHEAKAAAFLGGNFTPQMPTGGQPRSMSPGIAAPNGGSMGSTAQQGGFGLSGVVGQGSAVPGQASAMPGVASLSGQPLAVAPSPVGFSDPATPQKPSNQYAQISNALKSIAGAQQKQGQKVGGMMGAPDVGGRPISLQQARAMFDPGKFYGMLRGAGVGGQARGS